MSRAKFNPMQRERPKHTGIWREKAPTKEGAAIAEALRLKREQDAEQWRELVQRNGIGAKLNNTNHNM